MEVIHIYHTNDVHSHFESLPRIKQLLVEKRKFHHEKGDEFFLFDIGDFIDLWHPYSEATKGKGNIDILNECGYNAITIGNNEGINLSYQDLDHLYEHANFDVLVANLYRKDQTYPNWVKPYQIYSTKQGTRIGVIGLTAHYPHLFELLGWQLTEPLAELRAQIKAIKDKTEIIILLSHLGIHEDEQIALLFPEIDVILGGHTHHVLQGGKMVNQTLLCAAGKYGNFIGCTTLEVSAEKTVANKNEFLYTVSQLPAIKEEKDNAGALFNKGKEMLSQNISILKEPLEYDFYKETKLSSLLCKALREWCEADCSFINAGLLLGSLSGEVTHYDLLNVCPHPINPCKVELSGSDLQEVLTQTKDEKWLHYEVMGFGFRGKVIGEFVYNQISFQQNNHVIFVNSQIINPRGLYSLAVPDMFTFGNFFPVLRESKVKKYYLPEFLRDLLKWELQKGD